jgi:hypothetical protein
MKWHEILVLIAQGTWAFDRAPRVGRRLDPVWLRMANLVKA